MKLTKREIKVQRDLYNELLNFSGQTYWEREELAEKIYNDLNPSIVGDNISENGTYWTPYGLAQDLSVFAYRHGHVVDACAGIGMLAYRMHQMDSYDKNIQSMTCIELNPEFVKIGKKLIPSANWICADAYDQNLWEDLVKDLPEKKFTTLISNPPFGNDMNKKDYSWLNYTGHRDLMMVEIALRYAKSASFILPRGSCTFQYSGRPYYEDNPERYSQKLKKFIKVNKDFDFAFYCSGIDTSIYRDDWKNLPGGIGCEVAEIQIHPYTLDCKEDSITRV